MDKILDNKKKITTSQISNFSIFFLFGAPLAIILYVVYMFNPANIDNLGVYIIHILADIIGIFVILSLWLTILLDMVIPEHQRKKLVVEDKSFMKEKHSVDAFITVYGEPYEIVKKTVEAAVSMDYPHNTYILDDGASEKFKKLAKSAGAKYIAREGSEFAKAGNVNNGLKHSKADFFIIFDADHVPEKDFITKTLPYMANEKLAMVQTPQYYTNTQNFIARGAAQSQEIFYKFVCPAKNISDSAFCVGTNMLFRRKAIDEVGGIAEIDHSEDIWTSFQLHSKGWSTLFVNEVLAKGRAPETVVSYMKQQLRWAKGGFGMLFENNPLTQKNLSLDQRIQYFFANTFFFVGFSNLIYILLPILYMLFDIKSVITDTSWLIHYLPYIFMYYSLSLLFLGKLDFSTVSVSLSNFYAYIMAFFSIIAKSKYEWVATTSKKAGVDAIMKWIWPHVFLIILSILAIIVGWYEPRNSVGAFVNSIWVLWNAYMLFRFTTSDHEKEYVIGEEVNYNPNEALNF